MKKWKICTKVAGKDGNELGTKRRKKWMGTGMKIGSSS